MQLNVQKKIKKKKALEVTKIISIQITILNEADEICFLRIVSLINFKSFGGFR